MRSNILVLVLFFVGCATIYNPATQRTEYYFIDDTAEVTMGKNISQDITKENKVLNDPARLRYVRELGAKIAQVSDRNYLTYHFSILDEGGINAFSLPGGYIFVNKGLLDAADTEEVAFVLAHEIAHVAARHSVKRLQASLGMSLLLGLALKDVESTSINRAVNIVYNVVTLGYSRGDELLADSLAVQYMHRAGFNPQAGVSLMQKLKESRNDYTLVFLSSHPPPEQRIKNIEEKIKLLQ
jgi:predicted Zn-dependent protease